MANIFTLENIADFSEKLNIDDAISEFETGTDHVKILNTMGLDAGGDIAVTKWHLP